MSLVRTGDRVLCIKSIFTFNKGDLYFVYSVYRNEVHIEDHRSETYTFYKVKNEYISNPPYLFDYFKESNISKLDVIILDSGMVVGLNHMVVNYELKMKKGLIKYSNDLKSLTIENTSNLEKVVKAWEHMKDLIDFN